MPGAMISSSISVRASISVRNVTRRVFCVQSPSLTNLSISRIGILSGFH
jgi:hypothetical protein